MIVQFCINLNFFQLQEIESMSRTIGDRHSQKDSAELEGIRFDEAKWQHPYEATVHHPAENLRRQMNGDVGLG